MLLHVGKTPGFPGNVDLTWSGNNAPYDIYESTDCANVFGSYIDNSPTNRLPERHAARGRAGLLPGAGHGPRSGAAARRKPLTPSHDTEETMKNQNVKHAVSIALVAVLGLVVTPALAQLAPTTMNYQGRLTDNSPGQTPVNATVPMEFVIWDDPNAGTRLWNETWPAVTVVDGIFNVMLGGNGTPISGTAITAATDLYLEIRVDGEILTPRQALSTTVWAYRANAVVLVRRRVVDGPGAERYLATTHRRELLPGVEHSNDLLDRQHHLRAGRRIPARDRPPGRVVRRRRRGCLDR